MAKQNTPENNTKKELSRRDFLKAGGAVIASAVLFNSLAACTAKTTTATMTATKTATTTATQTATTTATQTATKTATTTATTTATSTATTTVVPKILKIGFEDDFGSTVSIDSMHSIEVQVEQDNKNGGITIGGQPYQVQLIEYDSKSTQAGETAAINRLVYEDNVKFIIGMGLFGPSWFPTTEKEKVICFVHSVMPPLLMNPVYTRLFDPSYTNALNIVLTGWFCKTYPQIKNSTVIALPDNALGHSLEQFVGGNWKTFGVTPQYVYFPANTQDFSSVATKVVSLQPSEVQTATGDAITDGLVLGAIYNAGYRGMFLNAGANTAEQWAASLPGGALDLLISGAFATEFDPPLTQKAQDFKAAWIAKYGKWTNPIVQYSSAYSCLTAALQKAGTVDSDKVTAVLNNGLQWDSPCGFGQLIARPDFGVTRTEDSIASFYIKKVKNGQAQLINTIKLADAINLFNGALQPASPPPTT